VISPRAVATELPKSITEAGIAQGIKDFCEQHAMPADSFVRAPPRLIASADVLTHFLAALAYRTQKALRGAPDGFAEFRAGHDVRTPAELVRHMASVLGYARTFFIGGQYRPEPLDDFDAEILRLHETIADLAAHLERGTPLREITPVQ
jgi:hypothetical protein